MKLVKQTKKYQIMTSPCETKSKFISLNDIKFYINQGWRYGRLNEF